MDIIEIEHVTKRFNGVTAVNDLSLSVPEKSVYGFIGPNGSGKTTTIRMIMNILYPESGHIRVFGKEQKSSRLEQVGYLPEERGLYKKMKVKELIRFHAVLKGGENINQETDYWLKRLDLDQWANKKVEALSKGMSQKLQFIVTIIDRPRIIILDEPFSGLDPVNAEIIRSAILELQESGSTVIFSTHDMNMAEKMCDYIFMIYRGEKVLDGTLTAIQNKYGNDTMRLQTEAGKSILSGIADINKVTDFGQVQELRLAPGSDPQQILSQVMSRTKVLKFEIASPSLNDIFIRIASPSKEDQK